MYFPVDFCYFSVFPNSNQCPNKKKDPLLIKICQTTKFEKKYQKSNHDIFGRVYPKLSTLTEFQKKKLKIWFWSEKMRECENIMFRKHIYNVKQNMILTFITGKELLIKNLSKAPLKTDQELFQFLVFLTSSIGASSGARVCDAAFAHAKPYLHDF